MTWARALVVLAVVGVLGYELIGVMDTAPGDTWSEHFWAAADRSHLPVFILGLICGHFVWPRKLKK